MKYFSYIDFHFILPTSSRIMGYSYPHFIAERHEYVTQAQQETERKLTLELLTGSLATRDTRGYEKMGKCRGSEPGTDNSGKSVSTPRPGGWVSWNLGGSCVEDCRENGNDW